MIAVEAGSGQDSSECSPVSCARAIVEGSGERHGLAHDRLLAKMLRRTFSAFRDASLGSFEHSFTLLMRPQQHRLLSVAIQ